MSLLEEYRSSLIKPGDGTVNPDIQARKRPTYSQMQIYYAPRTVKTPKKPKWEGALPDSILRIKQSRRIRRPLYDPNNTRFWNRIDNRRHP